MRTEYNVYCDESCHLQNDDSNVMVLGAVWCSKSVKEKVFGRIREIKAKYGFKPDFEIKWSKVSKAKTDFYIDLINYFFDDDHLHFRALVVPDKKALNHEAFNQDHNTFYYKMYFDLLKVILSPDCAYNIYIDIKDTRDVHCFFSASIIQHPTLQISQNSFLHQVCFLERKAKLKTLSAARDGEEINKFFGYRF